MAAGDTSITIVGNLVDNPELRFTPSGQAVARFRVASTSRFLDKTTNKWEDGDSLFLTCNVWRQQAENAAETLQRGMRVIVSGRLKQRSYETKEGDKRTVYEVEVDEVGVSLRNATAKVNKTVRQGGSFGPPEWNAATPQRPSAAPAGEAPAEDPWATGSSAVAGPDDFSDQPPF
ncbi:single-stranded DNA-binding protein 2 [Planobispora rosea]|uniref:Single-stranded DNA-binding protein n=1 Tax=Planobispora rosea TaxID=35762 RepID=A0A8J3S0Q9_PLARO|nr:single-stranded DNA-binding protein [Planobispora rosea]GGS84679.1 single-stranded DNA-binding protein 2 [Planobispora rosea]GIH86426.1 single-stranded DNA-binding protein 2 [Planobispora rosea]